MKKIILVIFCVISVAFAQEVVNPLYYNTQLSKDPLNKTRSTMVLELPFFDDFSNYKGYPNSHLWYDMDAYVNTTYPIDPLNIGVVTLDGLDSMGNPYNMTTPNAHGKADYLTSNPIDISSFTQVYFSFYYQTQGLGNAPENNDVLFLECLSDDNQWIEIWSQNGFDLSNFEEVQITISDPVFMHSDFQFRFYNKGTLSGGFDHWHLDNILLTEDANLLSDKDDVAFVYETSQTLESYLQMPWEHYKTDPLSFTKQDMEVILRNNFASTQPVNYMYDIISESWGLHYPIDDSDLSNLSNSRYDEVHSYFDDGLFSYSEDASPPVDIYENLIYPATNNTGIFYITHALSTNNSTNALFANNDTLRYIQEFSNFYALDDGSAEASYGINAAGGMVAMRFNLAKSDTLKAMQIHFEQSLEDVSSTAFKITVWNIFDNIPGDILYQSQIFYPQYTDQQNGYFEYVLNDPIILSGNVFIGWEQFYPNIINIGLDKNVINNDRMYYNVDDEWFNSNCIDCQGTWMLRPVFGSLTTTLIDNITSSKTNIYPNPMSDKVIIKNPKDFTLRMYNISGQLVHSVTELTNDILIYKNDLASGLYILEIMTEAGIHREKLIIK